MGGGRVVGQYSRLFRKIPPLLHFEASINLPRPIPSLVVPRPGHKDDDVADPNVTVEDQLVGRVVRSTIEGFGDWHSSGVEEGVDR